MKFTFGQVARLLNQLKPFLVLAGVPEARCSMPTGDYNMIKPKKYEDAFAWLDKILRSDEMLEVLAIWQLIPESQWKNYELFEVTGTAEQELLADRLSKLLILWKTQRPTKFFGANYEPEPDPYQEVPGQDETECDKHSIRIE